MKQDQNNPTQTHSQRNREVETGEQVGGESQVTAGLMTEVETGEQMGGAVR